MLLEEFPLLWAEGIQPSFLRWNAKRAAASGALPFGSLTGIYVGNAFFILVVQENAS
jgi:hypothetical protein